MREGYLLVETNPAHPGKVRLRGIDDPPEGTAVGVDPNLRFIARFHDLDAALMHFHAGLSRRLLDVNERIYRADPVEAVSVADAIELPHRRIYLDPALDRDGQLTAAIQRLHRRHRRWKRFFNGVGIAAVILLLAKLLLGV
jgi:hypothetical protein